MMGSDEGVGRLKKMLAENVAFSKGGVGIITPNAYIIVNSDKNELLLGDAHKKWTGLSRAEKQVVILIGDHVVDPAKLPDGYDISKATVISFEGNEIRFVDFPTEQAGFYQRISPN
jgi:hypothetical protein